MQNEISIPSRKHPKDVNKSKNCRIFSFEKTNKANTLGVYQVTKSPPIGVTKPTE